jgi:hypothetical protein
VIVSRNLSAFFRVPQYLFDILDAHFLQILCRFRFRLKHQIDSFASFCSYLCYFADKMKLRICRANARSNFAATAGEHEISM